MCFYNIIGELVLEEIEKMIVVLVMDEFCFYVMDNCLFKLWIVDVEGNVLVDFLCNIFQVKGEGSWMMVQIGVFKKVWLDLVG